MKTKVKNNSASSIKNMSIEKMFQAILLGQKDIVERQEKMAEAISRIEETLVDHGKRLKYLEEFSEKSVKYFSELQSEFASLREEMSEDLSKIKIELRNLGDRVLHLENSQMSVVRDVEEVRRRLEESKTYEREIVNMDKRISKLEDKFAKLEANKN